MTQSELFDSPDGASPDEAQGQSEVEYWARRAGHRLVVGVDEAGRGPLAGPVYVGCVGVDLNDPPRWFDHVADSKKLDEEARAAAFDSIRRHTPAWSIQTSTPAQIDRFNILEATRRAMARAIDSVALSLAQAPDAVFVDGNHSVDVTYPQQTVVDGDARSWTIAAASILAKVARDRYMVEQDGRWPHYGFASHKGYPTPAHLESLDTYGPAPIHRRSFAPVRRAIDSTKKGDLE